MSGTPTEKPTPRRLGEARRRGDVAVSRELTSAAALCGGLLALACCGPGMASTLARALHAALLHASTGEPAAGGALLAAGLLLGRAAIVPLLAAAVVAAGAAVLQVGPLWAAAAIIPRGSRISPVDGARRLFSGAQLATVGLNLLKAVAVATVGWHLGAKLLSGAALAATPVTALTAIARSAGRAATLLAALLLAFGGLDLLLVRRRHLRGLRMTLEEVRREQKEQDGDPQHKAERRRLHRGVLASMPVARATCVVVNPTHLAVALHHDPASEDAPVVVAKGRGDEARRIRSEARLASVPVVRDVPLARALYRLADVGDEIPQELYDAAAAILVHVHGLSTERTS